MDYLLIAASILYYLVGVFGIIHDVTKIKNLTLDVLIMTVLFLWFIGPAILIANFIKSDLVIMKKRK